MLLSSFFASSCLNPPLNTKKDFSVYTSKKSYSMVQALLKLNQREASENTSIEKSSRKNAESWTLEELASLSSYKDISNISYLHTDPDLKFKIEIEDSIYLSTVYKDVGDDLFEGKMAIFKDKAPLELTIDALKTIKGFPVCAIEFFGTTKPVSSYEIIPRIKNKALKLIKKRSNFISFSFGFNEKENISLYCGCLSYERRGIRSREIKNVGLRMCKNDLLVEDISQNLPFDVSVTAYRK